MEKKSFLPESMYEIDSRMTLKKLKSFQISRATITGRVLRLSSNREYLEVELGNKYFGKIPIEESTIYPKYKDSRLSAYVRKTIGKIVRVKVINIIGNKIFLSRSKSMAEALQYFMDNSDKTIEIAQITFFTKTDAFLDIGAGIIGKIKASDFSPTRFNFIEDVGFKKGDLIPVRILRYQSQKLSFVLSRIYPKAEIKVGDLVECTVFDRVENNPLNAGYYVLINRCIKGIITSVYTELIYGDIVLGNVIQVTPKGLKLDLVGKIDKS